MLAAANRSRVNIHVTEIIGQISGVVDHVKKSEELADAWQ